MVYLLWSTHIGIICGTGLYEVGMLTSLFATLLIILLDLVPIKKSSYLFIVNADTISSEKDIMAKVKAHAKIFKVKSRNLTKNKLDMIIELRTDKEQELLESVSAIEGVLNSSLVSHDGENFI